MSEHLAERVWLLDCMNAANDYNIELEDDGGHATIALDGLQAYIQQVREEAYERGLREAAYFAREQ